MKKIVLHAQSFNTFWAHYYVDKDQDFIDKLEAFGYQLIQSDKIDLVDLKATDVILFSEATSIGLHHFGFYNKLKYLAKILLGRTSISEPDFFNECQNKLLKEQTALLVAEGIVSMPENHTPRLAKMFPVIFTWNDKMVDNKVFFKYCIPQPVRWPKFVPIPFSEKKLLVNISGNKYESHPGELYSLRRESIKYFESSFFDQFELYGIGWNESATIKQKLFKLSIPRYSSYKGKVSSKTDVFPKFRFALCYENTEWPGYITEKVFDCMRSDCVPVYLGAPNIDDYLPPYTFIDRRLFSSDKELGDFLAGINENEYKKYQDSIFSFLRSEKFSKFLCTTFAERIINVIENRL